MVGRLRRSGGRELPIVMEIGNERQDAGAANRQGDNLQEAGRAENQEVVPANRQGGGRANNQQVGPAGQVNNLQEGPAVQVAAVEPNVVPVNQRNLDNEVARLANEVLQRIVAAMPAVPQNAPPQLPARQNPPPVQHALVANQAPAAQRALAPQYALPRPAEPLHPAAGQQPPALQYALPPPPAPYHPPAAPHHPPAAPPNPPAPQYGLPPNNNAGARDKEELDRVRRLLRNSQDSNRALQRELDQERYHTQLLERRLDELQDRYQPYNNKNNGRNNGRNRRNN